MSKVSFCGYPDAHTLSSGRPSAGAALAKDNPSNNCYIGGELRALERTDFSYQWLPKREQEQQPPRYEQQKRLAAE